MLSVSALVGLWQVPRLWLDVTEGLHKSKC